MLTKNCPFSAFAETLCAQFRDGELSVRIRRFARAGMPVTGVTVGGVKLIPRDRIGDSAIGYPTISYKLMILAEAARSINSETSPYMISST